MEANAFRTAIERHLRLLLLLERTPSPEWAPHVLAFAQELAVADIPAPVCLTLLASVATQLSHMIGRNRAIALPEWCNEAAALETTTQLLRSFEARIQEIARLETRTEVAAVEAAKRFIEEHYTQPLTTAFVASSVRRERTYFATIFRKGTGETIHGYVTKVRLRHALTCLIEGNKVEFAMLAAGYRNRRSFYRDFRRETGKTPGAFRNPLSTSAG